MSYEFDESKLYASYDNKKLTTKELYEMLKSMKIGTIDLEQGAVTNGKIADFAVDYAKIAAGSIGEVHIREASINHAAIQMAAIGRAHIQDAAIGTAQIENGSITSAKIGHGEIKTANIEEASITTAHIQDASITNAKIAEASIETAHIQDAAINEAKIAEAAITTAHIQDASITNAKIENGSITTAKIELGAITTALIDDAAITSAHIQDSAITNAKIMDAAINRTKIMEGEIIEAHIADASISTAKIADAAITNAKIDTLAVGTANIQDAAITNAKIEDAAIDSAKIREASINTAHIIDGSIVFGKIAEAAIGTANIIDAAITSAKIGAGEIKSANIEDASITTAKIQEGAITSALIGDAVIDASHIADATITDAKIVGLTANKITAGTIDTSLVNIQGEDGLLRISDNRLQVFDRQAIPVERVSIGDVDGDGTVYGFRVRGEDGKTVLYDENGVYNEGITDGAITNPKIGDNAIDSRVIAADSVLAEHIVAGEIVGDHIATRTLDANHIKTNAITAASGVIADAAITTAKIADAAITNAKIDSLDASKIKTGILDAERIKIGAGTLFEDGYDPTKMEIGGRNLIQRNLIEIRTPSTGDLSRYTTEGYLTIATGESAYTGLRWTIPSVKPNKYYTLSYSYRKISGNLVSFGGHTDSTYSDNTVFVDGVERVGKRYINNDSVFVGDDNEWHEVIVVFKTGDTVSPTHTVNIQPNRGNTDTVKVEIRDLVMVEGNKATDWTPAPEDNPSLNWVYQDTTYIDGGKIYANSITANQIDVSTITIDTANITNSAITTAKIGDAQITEAKIANLAVTNGKIANAAIDNAKIADAAIDTAKIQTGSITTALIADAAITNAKIDDASISRAKIQDAAINTAKIADGAITTAKIGDAQITNAKIANATIESAKIKDGAITNAKIANATIDAAKIKDATITNAKIADATIESAKIANLEASKITAGSFAGKTFTGGTFSGARFTSSYENNSITLDDSEIVIKSLNPEAEPDGTYTYETTIQNRLFNIARVGTGSGSGSQWASVTEDGIEGQLTHYAGLPDQVRKTFELGPDRLFLSSKIGSASTKSLTFGDGLLHVIGDIEASRIYVTSYGATGGGIQFPNGHSISVPSGSGNFYVYGNRSNNQYPFAVNSHVNNSSYRSDLEVRDTGVVWLPTTADNTSTNAVNMRIGTTGQLLRVTSSRKNKILPEPIKVNPYLILDLEVKDWYDRASVERYAELLELQEQGKEVDFSEVESLRRVVGLIAEEVEEAGLEQFVEYDEHGEVTGLQETRLLMLLIPIVRDLKTRLDRLENVV